MKWIIETTLTKKVFGLCYYTKDGNYFTHFKCYRWGEAFTRADTKPILGVYNEDAGLNILEFDKGIEYELFDCYYSRIIDMSDAVPEHIKTSLQNELFVEDDDIRKMEDDGWCCYKYDIMFCGTLQIEEQKKKHCRDA